MTRCEERWLEDGIMTLTDEGQHSINCACRSHCTVEWGVEGWEGRFPCNSESNGGRVWNVQ